MDHQEQVISDTSVDQTQKVLDNIISSSNSASARKLNRLDREGLSSSLYPGNWCGIHIYNITMSSPRWCHHTNNSRNWISLQSKYCRDSGYRGLLKEEYEQLSGRGKDGDWRSGFFATYPPTRWWCVSHLSLFPPWDMDLELAVAIILFKGVVNLELTRRENDLKVASVISQASGMMNMLHLLVGWYKSQMAFADSIHW